MSLSTGWTKASTVPLAVRLTWGSVLLVAPDRMLRLMGGVEEGTAQRRIMRVLGARHLVEAAAEAAGGGRARELGTGVDVIHGVVDVAFGTLDRRWRRATFTDAAITGLFVVLGVTNR